MSEDIRDRRPVVIVGAGPTGLTAALELTRLGIGVRIVDKAAGPSTTSKALAIQGRTLELLMDREVGAELLRLGNRATGAAMYSDGRRIGGVDVTLAPGRHNFILLLPQSETERVLSDALTAHGVKVDYGLVFTGLRDEGHGVTVTVRHPDGTGEVIDASYVIGADGARSQVRSAAEIAFDGRSLPQSYLLGDVRIDADIAQDSLSVFTGGAGFMAVFPLGDNRYRLMIKADDADADTPSLPTVQALFDHLSPVPGVIRELLWGSRFRIQSRHVPTLRAGRVFLGGDAAHVHSPAGGQGMNSGIQDMVNLCWKVALVLRGQARPALLDTYDSDRMPVIRSLIAMTEKMTTFTNTTNSTAHRLFRRLAPIALGRNTIQIKAATRLSQASISYRHAPSARAGVGIAGLNAGDRVPDWTVAVDGGMARLYELLDHRVPTLVTMGAMPDDIVRTHLGWADRVALRDVDVSAEQPDLRGNDARSARRFADQPAWLLVRPDGYLATAGGPGDASQLAGWLDEWLGAAVVPVS